MEPWEEEIDNILRRSLAVERPELSPDFERSIVIELDHTSKKLDKFRDVMSIGYLLVSAMACVLIMRGEGLDWKAIVLIFLAPLALLSAIPSLLRLTRTASPRSVL